MPVVVVVPVAIVVVEGVAVAGIWAYRIYRVVKLAQTIDGIVNAQEAAKPDEKANEKTDAQTKADTAVSSNCTNCGEDPDCQTARDKLKDALQGTKGEDADNRGLAERLCHWLHGTDEALRASHIPSIEQNAARVQKAMDWLTGKGKRPYGKKEGATLNGDAKKKMLKDCSVPADLKKNADDLLKFADEVVNKTTSVSPIPMANFAAECTKAALSMVLKAFGK